MTGAARSAGARMAGRSTLCPMMTIGRLPTGSTHLRLPLDPRAAPAAAFSGAEVVAPPAQLPMLLSTLGALVQTPTLLLWLVVEAVRYPATPRALPRPRSSGSRIRPRLLSRSRTLQPGAHPLRPALE